MGGTSSSYQTLRSSIKYPHQVSSSLAETESLVIRPSLYESASFLVRFCTITQRIHRVFFVSLLISLFRRVIVQIQRTTCCRRRQCIVPENIQGLARYKKPCSLPFTSVFAPSICLRVNAQRHLQAHGHIRKPVFRSTSQLPTPAAKLLHGGFHTVRTHRQHRSCLRHHRYRSCSEDHDRRHKPTVVRVDAECHLLQGHSYKTAKYPARLCRLSHLRLDHNRRSCLHD